jgi:hypothetical protein
MTLMGSLSLFHRRPVPQRAQFKHLDIRGLRFQELRYLQFPFSQIRTLERPWDWNRQAVLQTLWAGPRFDHL